MKTLFLLAFLLCISVGYGRKCYTCFSSKSWDDCASIKKEITCRSGTEYCGKAHVEGQVSHVSVAVFAKGCSTKAACDQNSCKDVTDSSTKITKCEQNCCSGDLCNGAKVPVFSAIMLLTCALVAFSV